MPSTAPVIPRAAGRALLLLATTAWCAPEATAQDGAPDDARVRQAWSYLLPEEQEEAAAWFSAEVAYLPTQQAVLLRQALALEAADPGFLPADPGIPWFDPKDHAPGQPIARKRLDDDDARALRVRERLFAARPAPRLPSAWRYDWSTRRVVRTADFRAPQHVFELGLAGFAPQADLAVALIERALDRGEQQLVLTAFGHAYTDREGLVFPGVTLYDAWGSGIEIEMPDVDNLGIVHTVTGERGRWKAPVPEEQHDELYGLVAEKFAVAFSYRAPRSALAQCYLAGSARLADGYSPHLVRFHGLWEEYRSSPADLAKVLPSSDDAAGYVQRWAKRFDKDGTRLARARSRLAQLDWDATQVRALLVRILTELGAFERDARPAPKPTPEPEGEDGR